ncbi:hypothetical protein Tco_1445726, partial [Tanacetum coccineum]
AANSAYQSAASESESHVPGAVSE